jgi:hypothetical protein
MHRAYHHFASAVVCALAISSAEAATVPTKSIQLSKVILNPDIAAANQQVKVGTICLFAGSPVDFGSRERTVNAERFERLFAKVVSARGFNVVAQSSNLFEDEGPGTRADFLIGVKLRPQAVNICDSVNGQKGVVTVAVEWQIFDRSKQQVVETIATQGSGQLAKFDPKGLEVMIDQGFSAAVTALIEQGMLQKHLGNPSEATVVPLSQALKP